MIWWMSLPECDTHTLGNMRGIFQIRISLNMRMMRKAIIDFRRTANFNLLQATERISFRKSLDEEMKLAVNHTAHKQYPV